MFDNVGREIKSWSKLFYILAIIGSVISGLGCLISGMDAGTPGLALIGCALIIVIGCILARLSVIMMYGFGELVECASTINSNVYLLASKDAEGNKHMAVADSVTKERIRIAREQAELAEKNRKAGRPNWICYHCKMENLGNHTYCQKCGTTKAWSEEKWKQQNQ